MKTPDPYKLSLQQERKAIAIDKLCEAGYDCHYESDTEIRFMYKGYEVKFFPYTGWASGKGIKDCRGINNLIKQLR